MEFTVCPKVEVKRVLKINDGKKTKQLIMTIQLQYIHETAECADLVLFKSLGSVYVFIYFSINTFINQKWQ